MQKVLVRRSRPASVIADEVDGNFNHGWTPIHTNKNFGHKKAQKTQKAKGNFTAMDADLRRSGRKQNF
jgi:hypothetical protein